jgi:hypothetical protein
MKSVLVYGPQKCGKTTNKAKIASLYGLTSIVDEAEAGMTLSSKDTLYLTNDEAWAWRMSRQPSLVDVVYYVEAMEFLKRRKP